MEAIRSSETSVQTRPTRCYIPEDNILLNIGVYVDDDDLEEIRCSELKRVILIGITGRGNVKVKLFL
jgi:hypothetical protein